LKTLRRTACDHLTVDQALTVEDLAQRCAAGKVPLISLCLALRHMPMVQWPSRLISRLRLGQQEILAQLGRPRDGEYLHGILDSCGQLAALAQWNVDGPAGRWQLLRIFKE
jgi:tRNA U55 pseudouridine synthase TruB